MWQVTLDLLPCARRFLRNYELGLPSVLVHRAQQAWGCGVLSAAAACHLTQGLNLVLCGADDGRQSCGKNTESGTGGVESGASLAGGGHL